MEHLITDIKAQKRNPQRVAIYLDGEFAFGLARIVAAWLAVGRKLDDREIAKLQDQDTLESAHQKALHFLSYRPRSVAEIEKKLAEKGFSEQMVADTVGRLQSSGLLNDEQFARTWVENRESFHPRSPRALSFELKQKGVAEEAIRQAIGDMPDEDSLAYQAAESHMRRLVALDHISFKKKLVGYLGRRGFSYEVIFRIVDRLWDELHLAEKLIDGGER